MSRPWPDELRQMVDALTRDGVTPQVTPLSATTWRVSVPYADADCGPGSMPWTCNGMRYRSWRELRAELTRVAVLAPRIHAAVPTARVTTTTDGIEVTVGSKSVRWKREKNGWSLGDDLCASEGKVIEHTERMAAEAAPKPAAEPPLPERLRTAIPSLTWRAVSEGECVGRDENGSECVSVVHQIDLGSNQAYIVTTAGETKDTATRMQGFDAVVQHVGRYLHGDGGEPMTWRNHGSLGGVATGNATLSHATPQPSPRAQALLGALRAQGYEPTYDRDFEGVHELVLCEGETAGLHKDEALWWYLAAQAGTEYVAEQMHLRIARRARASAVTASATISGADKTNVLDTAAAMHAAGETVLRARQLHDDEKFLALIDEGKRGANALVEQERAAGQLDEEFEAWKRRASKHMDTLKQRVIDKGASTMTTQTQPKTTTQALIQTATADASEAAWRTAGSQFVKLAREPLVGLLTRHLAPNDEAFRARLAAFLETELGTALLASMLSATLSAMPQTTGEVPQKLARELRVKAMADAGDVMADVLMQPLLQVMRLYLQDPSGAPAAPALPEADRSATSVDWSTAREVAR